MDDMKKIAGGTHDAIHSSRGMQHINRSYQRSFSINIFKINTQELIEITRRVNDPDEGLRFMSQDNREAGTQIHRETTRRIHNFVAASITLVDHTRNFMKENYANTPIFDRYQSKIDTEFLQIQLLNLCKIYAITCSTMVCRHRKCFWNLNQHLIWEMGRANSIPGSD